MSEEVQLDILLKAEAPPSLVTVENVGMARPRPEIMERCRRWLASKGLQCHATDFGLVCSGPTEKTVEVFGSATDPRAPDEIAEYVDQVTVACPPELF